MASPVVNLAIDPNSMFGVRTKSLYHRQKKFDELAEGCDLVLACDASYKDGIASIGITDGHEHWLFRLDNYMGHMLAELIAILQALRLSLREFSHPRKLLIATDCRTILLGLESANKNGRVSQATAAINFGLSWFYEPCDVLLLWVPGHRGIFLNVVADEIAYDARHLPENTDVEAILPFALRSQATRWLRRATADLIEYHEDSPLARYRDADLDLFDLEFGQSFLNADDRSPEDYPQFTWCELCRDSNDSGELQTFMHVFFECNALEEERSQLRAEFAKVGLPFRSDVIFDGYCIDATADFLDAVKAMKALYVT